MERLLNLGGIKWIHLDAPSKGEIDELIKDNNFHELIEDDLLELNTQDKFDVYDEYLFLVLHFPKFNISTKKYLLNEFNIILGKDFIVTTSRFKTNHIRKIRDEYQAEIEEKKEKFKITPYYVLYKIMDVMLDKSLNMLVKSGKDIVLMEEQIFSEKGMSKYLLEDLMIKKRNIVFLKHTYAPQKEIIELLQEEIPKFYEEDLDVYFEDLIYKLEKVENTISILFENIDSLSDTYNTLMTIRTNSIVTLLTIFTAVTGILTLISGIYGMNINLPFQHNTDFFLFLFGFMILVVLIMLLLFKRKGWI